jgi:glycosyltransferase involved in cell wall biosynthesis
MVSRIRRFIVRKGREWLGVPIGSGPVGVWSGYSADAIQLARHVGCNYWALRQPQQHPERIAAEVAARTCNWYIPPFENPFYGGIMTILRLANHLLAKHGIHQRFLICGAADRRAVHALAQKAFPQLSQAEVLVLDSSEAIEAIPPSDYSIATLWTTAYVLLGVQNTGNKYYMIQDFEPAFYPAGSTYAQAELTYRFGFYGIANTQSIKEIYEREYGGQAVVLRPCIDTKVFHPAANERPSSPKRLFYYARPGTPRNAFELAAAALRLVKERYADAVDIVCAGAGWDPKEFGLEGVVRNVGLLPYADTGDLYRSCHVGLVMMMTKHPSYLPFELMASGSIVVSNYNEANTWFLKDGENCLLSPPTASCLLDTVSYAIDQYEALEPMRKRAAEDILKYFGSWNTSLEQVTQFVLKPPAGIPHPGSGSRFISSR